MSEQDFLIQEIQTLRKALRACELDRKKAETKIRHLEMRMAIMKGKGIRYAQPTSTGQI